MPLKRSPSSHDLQMLSPKAHSRHPTWLPALQLLPTSDTQAHTAPTYTSLPEIAEDEDPFSHFLSPVLEEEASTEVSEYTAGIIPYTPPRRDALFRARLEEKWETYVARRLLQNNTNRLSASLGPPLPYTPPPAASDIPDLFDDDMDRAATPDSGPASPAKEDWFFPSTPDAEYDSDEEDGWAADRRRGLRITPTPPPRRKGRRSGRRRSWQEPGPELWPVLEEEEKEEDARGRAKPRGRKSVRWCEEVMVLEYEN